MLWRNLTAATSLYSVFQGEYPLIAKFRSGPRGPVDTYENWVSFQPVPQGHVPDMQTNMPRFAPENWPYMNKYAQENPDLLMLSTWRAASGLPKGTVKRANQKVDPLEISEIEYPGHWITGKSTTISADLSSTSTQIFVKSNADMKKGPALIVQNENGVRNYELFEYVLIKKVTEVGEGAVLTVERAFNGSPRARAFPATVTKIASMPWDFRSKENYINFFINFATDCPRDNNNMRALDIMVKEMVGPLQAGGPLEHLGGIDLASGPIASDPGEADYNGDGLVEPSTTYWEGVDEFYERLRKGLGPHRILTGNLDWKYVNYINGGNQEGLGRPNDPWKEVQRTVNEMIKWQSLSPLDFASIAFVQHLTAEEDLLFVQMHRLLNGYSVCLGMAAGMKLGDGVEELTRIELFKGEDNKKHWLGKRIGSVKRPATLTPNLLYGDGPQTGEWNDIIPSLTTKRAKVFVDGSDLVVRADGPKVGFMTLELNFQLERKSDFTVYLEAVSDDGKQEITTREIMTPRIFGVKTEVAALRARISNQESAPVTFYARGAEKGNVKIDLRFQGWDDVRFHALSVHAAPDTIACEFENGVVIANPSLEDETLDLTEIFPGRKDYQFIKAQEPTGNIESKYMPQYKQTMALNNGNKVRNANALTVGERNAVFLIANEITADGSSTTITTQPPKQPTTTTKPTTTVAPTTTTKPTTTVAQTTTTKQTTTKPTSGQEGLSCKDKKGMFRTHRGGRKICSWLKRFNNRSLNCGTDENPITELGKACQATCANFNGCNK